MCKTPLIRNVAIHSGRIGPSKGIYNYTYEYEGNYPVSAIVRYTDPYDQSNHIREEFFEYEGCDLEKR